MKTERDSESKVNAENIFYYCIGKDLQRVYKSKKQRRMGLKEHDQEKRLHKVNMAQ